MVKKKMKPGLMHFDNAIEFDCPSCKRPITVLYTMIDIVKYCVFCKHPIKFTPDDT